jgi:hypothetical protein
MSIAAQLHLPQTPGLHIAIFLHGHRGNKIIFDELHIGKYAII